MPSTHVRQFMQGLTTSCPLRNDDVVRVENRSRRLVGRGKIKGNWWGGPSQMRVCYRWRSPSRRRGIRAVRVNCVRIGCGTIPRHPWTSEKEDRTSRSWRKTSWRSTSCSRLRALEAARLVPGRQILTRHTIAETSCKMQAMIHTVTKLADISSRT